MIIACGICPPSRQHTGHSMGRGGCYSSHIIWHTNLLSSTVRDPSCRAPASAVPSCSQRPAQLKGLEKARGKNLLRSTLLSRKQVNSQTSFRDWETRVLFPATALLPSRMPREGLLHGVGEGAAPSLPPHYHPSAVPVSFLIDVA